METPDTQAKNNSQEKFTILHVPHIVFQSLLFIRVKGLIKRSSRAFKSKTKSKPI